MVAFARSARAGRTRLIFVSSVGAGGRGLYLRTNGETERAAAAMSFDRVDLVRPSLLFGPRPDRRPAEELAQAAAPLLDPLPRGPLARYTAIPAARVADAIAALTARTAPGTFIHHVPELRALAGQRWSGGDDTATQS